MTDHPIPLPKYTSKIVYACIDCCGDLIDENWNLWCPDCQRAWSFAEVAVMDEGGYDDD